MTPADLTRGELLRYARHLALPKVGLEGQRRLKDARVLCVGAGILFGQMPFVRENFSLVTIGIVIVSLLPMAVEFLRHRRRS